MERLLEVTPTARMPQIYTRDTKPCAILIPEWGSISEDCKRICFAFAFACVVGKNPKTPKLSPMADYAITRGGIGSLVSLVYICDVCTSNERAKISSRVDTR